MRTKSTKMFATVLVAMSLVSASAVGKITSAEASTSYCGHGTDGFLYYHTFQYHFSGAGPYMHMIQGWSRDNGVDHYDGNYCTN